MLITMAKSLFEGSRRYGLSGLMVALIALAPSLATAQQNCLVEVVFVMDTSGSMGNEALTLCNVISPVEQQLLNQGIMATTHLLGITQTPGGPFSCLTNNVANLIGNVVPGNDGACGGTLNQYESWGQAVAVIAAGFPWQPGHVRVVVPISDECACGGGESANQADLDAIDNAIVQATVHNVLMFPIAASADTSNGPPHQDVLDLANLLAAGTGGTAFISIDSNLDLPGIIEDLVIEACPAEFLRGDCNNDSIVNVADIVWSLSEMFLGGPSAPCQAASDVNDDNALTLEDPVYLASYLFLQGPPIPAPYPSCGLDLDMGDLDCAESICP